MKAPLEAMKTPVIVEPKTEEIPQPNATGEFLNPADGAIWMALTYGIPQTPLKAKAPFLQNWPTKASTDPAQIRAWAVEYPGCNFGSVAIAGKHFIFEADSIAVRERFKNRGHDFTSNLIIESSPGKGHRYYLSAPGVENVGQNKGEDFSIRANGEQCVSPGSVHPLTGRQYRVAEQNGPLTQPTAEEILFWKSERTEKKSAAPAGIDEPILEGQRNSTITSILGKARQNTGADYEVLIALARQHNQRCVPPLSDSELQTIAHSVARYKVTVAGPVVMGGQVLGQQPQVQAAPVEVRPMETEPINQVESAANGIDHLPSTALSSTRLQDIFMDFDEHEWPLTLALPALVTAASVVVPFQPKRDNLVLGDDRMTNLYTALIADVNAGKSQIINWAATAIGIYEPPVGQHYFEGKWGSAEQMLKSLHKKQSSFLSKSVLINPDEWSHLFAKARIPDASFPTVMTTSFYRRNQIFTLGGQGGGKEYMLNLQMSFIGGIVEDEFDTVFGAGSLGGLYDRFLFGRAPDGFHWNYRDCPFEQKMQWAEWNLKPVTIDPSVYEVVKTWSQKNPGLGRVAEICVRIAVIYASLDGRPGITGKDMEPLKDLALYQVGLRQTFRPNPGKNPDAVFANKALAWIQKHAEGWTSIAKLKQHTWRIEQDLGPAVAVRSLIGLARSGRIDLWLPDNGSELPSDYAGPRPRIGLVRRVK
jgi:hypothetical protein